MCLIFVIYTINELQHRKCFVRIFIHLLQDFGKLTRSLRSLVRFPKDWTGLDWTGLDWTGLDWTGLDWTGLDWTGLDWTGLDWTGLDWTGLNSTLLYSTVLCFEIYKEVL